MDRVVVPSTETSKAWSVPARPGLTTATFPGARDMPAVSPPSKSAAAIGARG